VIVVSDTSPLNYLILIDAIEVLPKLFLDIHVPDGVMRELQHPRTPAMVKRWAEDPPSWLHIGIPSTQVAATAALDLGEAQAIALATELHAVGLLMDERRGRRIAQQQGFTVLGTITVLELAARQGLLDLTSAFTALSRTSFQIKPAYFDAALERDAAWKLAQENAARNPER